MHCSHLRTRSNLVLEFRIQKIRHSQDTDQHETAVSQNAKVPQNVDVPSVRHSSDEFQIGQQLNDSEYVAQSENEKVKYEADRYEVPGVVLDSDVIEKY